MNKLSWTVTAVLGVVIVLVILAGMYFLGAWNNGGRWMMDGWGSGMMHSWGFRSFGWAGMILMWLIPVGLIVLVVLGISGLLRNYVDGDQGVSSPHYSKEDQSTAQEILKIRYARGEITREQYLEMLSDIS